MKTFLGENNIFEGQLYAVSVKNMNKFAALQS